VVSIVIYKPSRFTVVSMGSGGVVYLIFIAPPSLEPMFAGVSAICREQLWAERMVIFSRRVDGGLKCFMRRLLCSILTTAKPGAKHTLNRRQ